MNKYDPKYLDEDEKDLIESINEMDVSYIKPPTNDFLITQFQIFIQCRD